MTTQEELTMLETAYSNFVTGGAVQSYSINGRMLTRASAEWIAKRMDLLRRQLARESTDGAACVARFVDPE